MLTTVGILMELWRVYEPAEEEDCATGSTTVPQNLMELGPKIL
jgi:hypothetical protein